MKKVLAIVLILIAGVAIGRFDGGAPRAEAVGAQGGGAASCAAKNGDVNGDGRIDLSDAVTILGNLFLGSPAVLVPLCSSQGGRGLPDTGQTQCYTCSGEVCSGFIQDFLGDQDSFLATGCPNDANRFTDHGNGTVTDNCTGLMWQKEASDVNDDGNVDEVDRRNWCNAMAFCHNLVFAGHDDWRLPNVRELQSLVDFGENGLINPVFRLVPGAESNFYWTSTSSISNPIGGWQVEFNIRGTNLVVKKADVSHFRAVRAGP